MKSTEQNLNIYFDLQQKYLISTILFLTLAAIMSTSLSAVSLYHVITLKAEVATLKTEVFKKREEHLVSLTYPVGEMPQPNRDQEQRVQYVNEEDILEDLGTGNSIAKPGNHRIRLRRSNNLTDKTVLQPCLQMIANKDKGTFQKGLKRGTALEEQTNAIIIKETGYFFVYSQVYYKDKIYAMGHIIVRKKASVVGDELQNVNLFRCIQNMSDEFPFNTCYTAGIAKLEEGDSIELLIPRQSAVVSLDGDSTFFGAIKLI
ncbi:tumor necrosis factor ligand superfamily member 13B-like isoform X2 [Acipenser ruthenus]|uniref:tumor necrosis factor ligand superfamily member 13B-like isoform X2 n=1 Tax=Acipenser ruthenus TaxID=7906 RepID=UPI002740E978|nr:tumor necrosis factor ligand superfamily member 13B-like isoform X2 [Acipenser ruthenus]